MASTSPLQIEVSGTAEYSFQGPVRAELWVLAENELAFLSAALIVHSI